MLIFVVLCDSIHKSWILLMWHVLGNKDKNDPNGGIWQSGISKSLAEYVQRPVSFVNVQSSLHENVVFSVCALMDNAA